MLELTHDQLRQLQEHEQAGFVSRVRADVVRNFPDVDSPDLETRLLEAHRVALQFGLESSTARTQFLYQEAFAPSFYRQPAIAAWLTRPGEPPEQRWRDFMALATARVKER